MERQSRVSQVDRTRAPEAAPLKVGHRTATQRVQLDGGVGPAGDRYFLQRFNEGRGGWARHAVQNHAIAPAADGAARTLDSAIAAAAADGGGHRLTRIDLEVKLRTYLHAHPFATPDEVVRRAADVNSGGSAEYRTTILGRFHRAHPSWAAEHPAAGAPAAVAAP